MLPPSSQNADGVPRAWTEQACDWPPSATKFFGSVALTAIALVFSEPWRVAKEVHPISVPLESQLRSVYELGPVQGEEPNTPQAAAADATRPHGAVEVGEKQEDVDDLSELLHATSHEANTPATQEDSSAARTESADPEDDDRVGDLDAPKWQRQKKSQEQRLYEERFGTDPDEPEKLEDEGDIFGADPKDDDNEQEKDSSQKGRDGKSKVRAGSPDDDAPRGGVAEATKRNDFIDLHLLWIASPRRMRWEEYCVTLRLNAQLEEVSSVRLVTALEPGMANELLAECFHAEYLTKLTSDDKKSKIKFEYVASEDQLSYKTLLQGASKVASANNLQIVLNSDIVIAWDSLWHQTVRDCLTKIYKRKVGLHLTRSEPEECYPLLDEKPRTRSAMDAPDQAVYKNLCKHPWGGASHDAIAFNRPLDEETLDALAFPPNRLGAENLLGCMMNRHGYLILNPCHQLVMSHNHCSDVRNYSSERIDKAVRGCRNFGVIRRDFSGFCQSDEKHQEPRY